MRVVRRLDPLCWGAYGVETEDGKIVSMKPFSEDPDPSPIGFGMPQALGDPVRIQQPMIRKGWLDRKDGKSASRRGEGQYVAVSWEKAIKLVAGEIERVRETYGNNAIFLAFLISLVNIL